jgi:hypothetical protein
MSQAQPPSDERPAYRIAADAIGATLDADVLLVNAPIYPPVDQTIRQLSRRRRRRPNVVLLLVTQGGDAATAYRIARSLQLRYTQFVLLVSGFCKSAGTLVAIGAHELVVADSGELGPLDVQMTKPDELLQRQSGLTATTALQTLHEQAFHAFEHFLLSYISRGGHTISTRTATHVAVQLTSGLFAPIYEHVDPMHVGEAGRALMVAQQYGERLDLITKNLRAGALNELTASFASHDFVIDRDQVQKLFQRVREPNTNEIALIDALGDNAIVPFRPAPGQQAFVAYLNEEPLAAQVLPGLEQPHASTSSPESKPGTESATDAAAAAQPAESGRPHPTRNAPDSRQGDVPAA